MKSVLLGDWLAKYREPKEIDKPLTTIYFDYSEFTLEEIDTYRYSTFEFDGDSKKIKVTIPLKKEVVLRK